MKNKITNWVKLDLLLSEIIDIELDSDLDFIKDLLESTNPKTPEDIIDELCDFIEMYSELLLETIKLEKYELSHKIKMYIDYKFKESIELIRKFVKTPADQTYHYVTLQVIRDRYLNYILKYND